MYISYISLYYIYIIIYIRWIKTMLHLKFYRILMYIED